MFSINYDSWLRNLQNHYSAAEINQQGFESTLPVTCSFYSAKISSEIRNSLEKKEHFAD